ncbi:hypothetical protein ANO11243_092810 [Dothideomycetidae sp. 11243]|nr:hypothetical protein ANO11243_092810 [fungal sp. No.11243]
MSLTILPLEVLHLILRSLELGHLKALRAAGCRVLAMQVTASPRFTTSYEFKDFRLNTLVPVGRFARVTAPPSSPAVMLKRLSLGWVLPESGDEEVDDEGIVDRLADAFCNIRAARPDAVLDELHLDAWRCCEEVREAHYMPESLLDRRPPKLEPWKPVWDASWRTTAIVGHALERSGMSVKQLVMFGDLGRHALSIDSLSLLHQPQIVQSLETLDVKLSEPIGGRFPRGTHEGACGFLRHCQALKRLSLYWYTIFGHERAALCRSRRIFQAMVEEARLPGLIELRLNWGVG